MMAVDATATALRVPLVDLGPASADVAGALDGAWSRIIETSGFVGGPEVDAFERDWAAYCGRARAVGLANGTDAIELVLRALGVGPGDEVIVPTNTFVATVEAVLLAGATPRLIDVDPDTLVITAEAVERACSDRTAAVVAVHLHGNMPDMDALARVSAARGLALIEDAAQAHGSTWRGRRAGSFGVASCFSFYPGKNLGAFGDAGAVVTDDAALAATVRSMANHGRSAESGSVHERIGRNSRLDALQAAVLGAKLARLDGWNARRQEIAARYRAELPPTVRPIVITPGVESSYHQFVVQVEERDAVREALRRRGVETGIHYPFPCHRQLPYAAYAAGRLPVADKAAARIMSLPVFPHLTDAQVAAVCDALAQVVGDGP
jgi:dTDP-4-amino-4,6-dideoxygalactose transaminase